MRTKQFIYLAVLVAGLVIFMDSGILAQPATGGPPDPPSTGAPPCWPPSTCVPIDGGIAGLIAIGLALVGRHFYKSRKTI